MPKRLYEDDNRLNEAGRECQFKTKQFLEELIKWANESDLDLNDLGGLLHAQIDGPIWKRIIDNRREQEKASSYQVNPFDPLP